MRGKPVYSVDLSPQKIRTTPSSGAIEPPVRLASRSRQSGSNNRLLRKEADEAIATASPVVAVPSYSQQFFPSSRDIDPLSNSPGRRRSKTSRPEYLYFARFFTRLTL
ncbi:MAG: hypothetical protein J2P21_03610 [Chloracidobacterium sp.]|nr:hypothetical protein [Chloracidobacterium sp.]